MSHFKGEARQGSLYLLLTCMVVLMAPGEARALGKKRPNPPLAPVQLTPSGPHGVQDVRFMSYNIHGVQAPGNDHSRYKEMGRLFRAMRAAGVAPEIFAVQEAFHERTHELVTESAFPYYHYGPQHKGVRTGSGLVILSEYPIVDADEEIFDLCFGVDCFARKGVLRVRVVVPGLPAPIDVYDTHMNASYTGLPPYETDGDLIRVRQAAELGRFYNAHADPDALSFVLGDFNTRYGNYAYAVLDTRLGMLNVAQACVNFGTCSGPPAAATSWKSYIDHQFYSPGDARTRDGSPVTVQPVHLTRVNLGADHGNALSDHDTYEVTYRVTW